MGDTSLLPAGLAFLSTLGYALIAAGSLSEARARYAAVSTLAALGLAAVGYVATGFALQFGGIGLIHNDPGYEALIWEWSALGVTWGTGWGMAGLAGWGMAGDAGTPAAYALALANLPWVTTCALIPLVSLRGRIPAWASGLLGLLVGAVIYPLAGNWIWGGGWLANLGSTIGQGHGLVDAGGAGLVHVLGAAVTLAGILACLPLRPKPAHTTFAVSLPPVHLPVLAFLGAGLILAGNLAWMTANPLLPADAVEPARIALNGVLAAGAGGLLPLLYTWFVSGRPDPLMAARGLAAGSIACAAAAPFIPPWAALVLGGVVGILMPFAIFTVDHLLRIEDPTAVLSVHGLGGSLGLMSVALLADGSAGINWNGVGAHEYLDVARQGVTGLLAAPGFQPDWPAQFQAQLVGLAALAIFGFFAAWLVVAPPAIVLRLIGRYLRPAAALVPSDE